jgi:hypothetical protein
MSATRRLRRPGAGRSPGLDPAVPEQKEILDLFGAERFIATTNDNYAEIERGGPQIAKFSSAIRGGGRFFS